MLRSLSINLVRQISSSISSELVFPKSLFCLLGRFVCMHICWCVLLSWSMGQQMTDVSFESGQCSFRTARRATAGYLANPLCPPWPNSLGQTKSILRQFCFMVDIIDIRQSTLVMFIRSRLRNWSSNNEEEVSNVQRKREREREYKKWEREKQKSGMKKWKWKRCQWFRLEMSFVGRHISSLPTPALIVDKEKVICETPSLPLDLFMSPS